VKRRFHLSIGRRGIRRDVENAIQFYLDMREQELIDEGVHPDLAWRAAMQSFGNRRAVADEIGAPLRHSFHRCPDVIRSHRRAIGGGIGRQPGTRAPGYRHRPD
jgi:hypothetical protein